MSSLKQVVAKLSKSYSDSFKDVRIVGTIPRLYLESPSLNYAFGGGFGLGRIYEFSGPESGGKSTLATYIGGEIQRKNDRNVVVYVDFEHAFDEKYANTLGLSTDQDKDFVFLRPDVGEDAFVILGEMVKELPIGLIIWDSLAVTPTRGQVEDFAKADFGGTAKLFAGGLKYLNPRLSNTNTSMIVINQERANTGVMYGPDFKTTGGYAIKYYASWRGRITRVDDIKDKGITTGIISKVRNVKNKIGIPKREALLELRFADGFDSDNEYTQFLVDLGIVEKRGAWFYQEEWDFKGQGRDSIMVFLKERPELFRAAKEKVNQLLTQETILDENNEPDDDEDDGPPPED